MTSPTNWDDGLEALARSDWDEACRLLTSTLEAEAVEAHYLAALGDAAWWRNDLDTCMAARERAFGAFLEEGDEQNAAQMALELAHDNIIKLRASVGRGWLARARTLLTEHPRSRAAGYLARMDARQAFEADGDFERAVERIDDGIEIARELGDRNLEVLVTHDKGHILTARGDVAAGIALMEEAMVAVNAGEVDAYNAGRIYCNMITACIQLSDFGTAAQWNDEADRWCEQVSNDSGYPGICRVRRSEIYRRRGLLDAAADGARRAAGELQHFLPFAAQAHVEMGNVHLQRGELDEAEKEFMTAYELGDDAMPGMARLRIAQGKPETAASLMDAALGSTIDRLSRARLLPVAVDVYLADDSAEKAKFAAEEVRTIADEFGSPGLGAAADYAEGVVKLAEGNPGSAVGLLRRAFRHWSNSGLATDAAEARLALARAFDGLGQRETARLERASAQTELNKLSAQPSGAGESMQPLEPETVSLVESLEEMIVHRYAVTGAYTRWSDEARTTLGDARQRILGGLDAATGNRENHLVWAAPGSGKTFLVEEIARERPEARYAELNLARLDEDEFTSRLEDATDASMPTLILIDEVDARPTEAWPYQALMPRLDVNRDGGSTVFVMAGSGGGSLDGLGELIRSRPKGADVLSRTPQDHHFVVPELEIGDQLLIGVSQTLVAAGRAERTVRAVERAALVYLISVPYLANARQLAEFAARAVDRMPPGEDRLKFDHLFGAGDPESKQFWSRLDEEQPALIGSYVVVTP